MAKTSYGSSGFAKLLSYANGNSIRDMVRKGRIAPGQYSDKYTDAMRWPESQVVDILARDPELASRITDPAVARLVSEARDKMR